jgi:hypothetical protein
MCRSRDSGLLHCRPVLTTIARPVGGRVASGDARWFFAPAAVTAVLDRAKVGSGRHSGPRGLVDACCGGRPPGPVVAPPVALDPVGLRAGAAFGTLVATAGTLMVVGAPTSGGGVAYVYTRDARAWRESAQLHAPDTQVGDFFGGAVAVTGTTIVVGADNHDKTGTAYVFAKESSGWRLTAELAGAGDRPGSAFGYSVAIGAGTIVVGAPMPVLGTGTAYVFRKGRGGWRRVAELRPTDALVGGFFGFSVATSGPEAVVGDPGDMGGAGRASCSPAPRTGCRDQMSLIKPGRSIKPSPSVGLTGTSVQVEDCGADQQSRATTYRHRRPGRQATTRSGVGRAPRGAAWPVLRERAVIGPGPVWSVGNGRGDNR